MARTAFSRRSVLAGVWAAALALCAAGAGRASGAAVQAEEIAVFAAASLADALGEVGRAWTKASGHRAVFNFGASSDLSRQIRAGAAADVFLSADEAQMDALERETTLFVASHIRENRRLPDLLTANETFVNERLARHYEIPNIYGSHFRRVAMSHPDRVGVLGHGSILTVTSYPRNRAAADRAWTSRVLLSAALMSSRS